MPGMKLPLVVVLLASLAHLYVVKGKSLKLGEKTCELFFFYDHGTDLCEPCKDVCDFADIRGTEEQCASSCSDYLKAKNCTPEEYYDEHIRECSPCAELCQYKEARGTEQQCNEKCRGYITKGDPGTIPETTSPLAQPPQSNEPPQKTPSRSEHHQLLPNITLAVLLAVITAVTLILLVVAIYCMKTRFTAYTQAPQTEDTSVNDLDVIKYGQQEHGQPAAVETQPGEREELVVNCT